MGLIIKDKIKQLMAGYPTVSDKYDVAGAVLGGSKAVKFGDVVNIANGYFESCESTALTGAGDVGGIVVATNVKVPENFPGTIVQVNPGEAFNLLVKGFIAVNLNAGVTEGNIKPNTPVYVTPAGKFTNVSASNFALSNTVFTGVVENGVAEIYIR